MGDDGSCSGCSTGFTLNNGVCEANAAPSRAARISAILTAKADRRAAIQDAKDDTRNAILAFKDEKLAFKDDTRNAILAFKDDIQEAKAAPSRAERREKI